MGTSQTQSQTNECQMDQPVNELCERTVAMNLIHSCHTTTPIDEMNCEEWGNGTDQSQVSVCRGCVELRKEVNDLRQMVSLILPMLPIYPPIPTNLAAGLAVQPTPTATATAIQNVFQQSLLRKRAAAQTPSVPHAECPGPMRTVMNNAGFQNLLLNHWMLPGGTAIKEPSPALPNGTLQPMNDAQLPSADEPQVKYSSPSSVDSNGQKTDSSAASAGDTQNIDIIGDGSESPADSVHSQQEISNILAQQHSLVANVLKESFLFSSLPAPEPAPIRVVPPQTNGTATTNGMKPAAGGPERKPRKPVNDDIVKIVRNQDLSEQNIETFEIPVPKALESDPTFRPVSEQQIIQQIIQGKKYEEMEVGECMIQLCKKLAEKRVFGPRLMSQTTVAGLNHSNYSNLPIKGICYIQHVCRKVLLDKFEHEEDFWDKFREAMRKLAARCRRVRHAKKTKHNREEAQAEMLSKRYGEDIPFNIAHNGLLRPKLEPAPEPTHQNDGNNITTNQISQILSHFTQERKGEPVEIVQALLAFMNRQKIEQVSPTLQ